MEDVNAPTTPKEETVKNVKTSSMTSLGDQLSGNRQMLAKVNFYGTSVNNL